MLISNRRDYLKIISDSYQCFERYKSPLSTGARLPGMRSGNGVRADSMEAFSRLMPAIAAVDISSSDSELFEVGISRPRIRSTILQGIVAGTDPASPEYWGDLSNGGQAVCEASDIAIIIWLTKEWLFDQLTTADRSRIEVWLYGALKAEIPDNNWHLFLATIGWVLKALFDASSMPDVIKHLNRVKSFSREDGLFHDGPEGEVDGYTSWGFHYQLGLLQYMGCADASWSEDLRIKSNPLFLHLISANGWPVFGRSIHYRTAITASLSVSVLNRHSELCLGQVRRATDATWSYFLERGLLDQGRFTQGYWSDDVDLLEGYAGPASPLWCLRSIIPLLLISGRDEFWSLQASVLPVESVDYEMPFGQTGRVLVGDFKLGVVQIINPLASRISQQFLRPNIFERGKSLIRGVRYRPSNYEARYQRALYTSDSPFFVR